YSRNIDVVILRSISRMIYLFVLIALGLIWVPTIVHVSRFPFAMCFTVLLVATLASFTIMVVRLPREARPVVRRPLRTRRVLTAPAPPRESSPSPGPSPPPPAPHPAPARTPTSPTRSLCILASRQTITKRFWLSSVQSSDLPGLEGGLADAG